MSVSDYRVRAIGLWQSSVAGPLVKLAFRFGLPDPGDALLETTARDTGEARITPVCDCLEGNTFWVISQRGRDTQWMRDIELDPRVRVKTHPGAAGRWRVGTAHILDDDDPVERRRLLNNGNVARQLCLAVSSAATTEPLTVRIDLDGARRAPRRSAPGKPATAKPASARPTARKAAPRRRTKSG